MLFDTPEPQELQTRDFDDAATTRQWIYEDVLKAASELPPVQNKTHTLRLADAGYSGPEQYSKAEQKLAILEGRSLTRVQQPQAAGKRQLR